MKHKTVHEGKCRFFSKKGDLSSSALLFSERVQQRNIPGSVCSVHADAGAEALRSVYLSSSASLQRPGQPSCRWRDKNGRAAGVDPPMFKSFSALKKILKMTQKTSFADKITQITVGNIRSTTLMVGLRVHRVLGGL